jgi:predicted acylesterase/phospholipase RssA
MEYSPKIRTKKVLCMSGGGAPGYVWHMGLGKAFKEKYGISVIDYFDTFIGTSAGSLAAATYATGMQPDEVSKRVPKSSEMFPQTFPHHIIDGIKKKNSDNVMGALPMTGVDKVLEYNFNDRGFKTLGDVRNNGKRLCVTAFDIGRMRPVLLDSNNDAHAHIEIKKVVAASCSIPILMGYPIVEGRKLWDGGTYFPWGLPLEPSIFFGPQYVLASSIDELARKYAFKKKIMNLERTKVDYITAGNGGEFDVVKNGEILSFKNFGKRVDSIVPRIIRDLPQELYGWIGGVESTNNASDSWSVNNFEMTDALKEFWMELGDSRPINAKVRETYKRTKIFIRTFMEEWDKRKTAQRF